MLNLRRRREKEENKEEEEWPKERVIMSVCMGVFKKGRDKNVRVFYILFLFIVSVIIV